MTPQALLTLSLAYFPTFPQKPNSKFNKYDAQNNIDLLSKHFDSVSKTRMFAFLVDLMNFQICQTFQAQDWTCTSFFLVDLMSKHFDSVSITWMFAFLVDLMNYHICQTFQAQDRICMSFFPFSFISKHFDSVFNTWMFAFLVDLMNF